MIQIEKKQEAKSFFFKDKLFDLFLRITYHVKIFGITIYKRKYDYTCEITEQKTESIGFK
jgi:hypothetical protein